VQAAARARKSSKLVITTKFAATLAVGKPIA
jgi:hypothetical protein